MLKRMFGYLRVILYIALLAAVVASFIPGISDSLQRVMIAVFGIGVLVLKIYYPAMTMLRLRNEKRPLLLCWLDLIVGIILFIVILLALFTNLVIHWAIIALPVGLSIGISFLGTGELVHDR